MKFAQKFSISMAIIASGLMVLPVFAADPPAPGSAAPASASASASATPSGATPASAAPAAPAAATAPATPVAAKAEDKTPKVKCREEKVTGSSFRTRKVCTSTDSQNGSGDWVREQQQRGSIGASAILNGGGG
jgi:hypothetical protein